MTLLGRIATHLERTASRLMDWPARERGETCWNCGRRRPTIAMAYGDARLHDQRRLCGTCAALAQMQ